MALTLADPYLFVMTGWADKMIGLDNWPKLTAFRNACSSGLPSATCFGSKDC